MGMVACFYLGPTTYPAIAPQQPYRDPRAQISAYFSIACHSATGSSLMRFSSAPDTVSLCPPSRGQTALDPFYFRIMLAKLPRLTRPSLPLRLDTEDELSESSTGLC